MTIDRTGGGGAGRRWLLPLAWRRAVLATAALWAVVLVVTAVAAGTLPAAPVAVDPAPPGYALWPPPATDATGWQLVGDALVRFDALYYLGIADTWYPPSAATPGTVADSYAFFPAYPALVRGLGWALGGRLVLAATLVSTLAAVAAFAGTHRLVEELVAGGGLRHRLGDRPAEDVAGRAVALLALFPTSFFLLAPYAESLHLAAVVWSLVLGARARTAPASLLAVLAAATRPVGLLLSPAMWVLTGGRDRDDGAARRRVALAAAPLVGLGLVALNGFVLTGRPIAFGEAQARWERTWRPPWLVLRDAYRFALEGLGGPASGYFLLDAVVFTAVAAAVLALAVATVRDGAWRRGGLAPALVVHAVASIGLWLVQVFPGRPLMSVPRFALSVPAVVVGLLLLTRRGAADRAWVLASGVLLGLHLLLFSRWYLVF